MTLKKLFLTQALSLLNMLHQIRILMISIFVLSLFLVLPPINSTSPEKSGIFISTPFSDEFYSTTVHYRIISSEDFLNKEVSLHINGDHFKFNKNFFLLSPIENLFQDISRFPAGSYQCYLTPVNQHDLSLSNPITIAIKTDPPLLSMKNWPTTEPKKVTSRNFILEAVSIEKLKQVSLYIDNQMIPMEDYGFSWKWQGSIPLKNGINEVLLIGTNYHQVSSRQLLRVSLEEKKNADKIPILVYHNVGYMHGPFNVSPEAFETQMKELVDMGCYFADPDEIYQYYQGKLQLPEKTVLITFDDGYRGVLQYALPILKKYHIKATLFVVTSFIGNTSFLTWDQLDLLAYSPLITIGSHTHRLHFYQKNPSLPFTFPAIVRFKISGETEEAYQIRIMNDLEKSRELLQQRYKKEIIYFAYPFGAHDNDSVNLVRKAGFKLAFSYNSQQKKMMNRNSNQFMLERYPLFQYSTSKDLFKEK